MKKTFWILVGIICGIHALGQAVPAQVRLAILPEMAETQTAADVLTAELSKNNQVQLLERAEIERVYREQGLSAGGKDYLKLGQVLGADGVLAIQSSTDGTNKYLTLQLVAVKPGVILSDEHFGQPAEDVSNWAQNVLHCLTPLLPKLSVLSQDAVPISLVNFHAGVRTPESVELEQQIFFLTMERLVREKRLFVLERKRMQSLSEEKYLANKEAEPFWTGKYLLDGAIDRDGFNPNVVTISARLIPPGGSPILIEAKGGRTNCTEVVNQFVERVMAALKIDARPEAWNTADEADRFFKEAQWNLAWKIFPQARQSAEAAWALGKHDADCMNLRVRTFMPPPDSGVIYFPPRENPEPEKINDALHALQLYQMYSQYLLPDEPKPDSDWYKLGLDNLTIATRVLQQFNWSPEFYGPVSDKLAELRAQARAMAQLLSRAPSVHDSYFVGSRKVTYDDLHHFEEQPSIYGLKLEGGCMWQEKPEDTLALYRELMSSPVFRYLHERLWFREGNSICSLPRLPERLIAWNETDQKRLPDLWQRFVAELKESPDVFQQVEARALRLADVKFPDLNQDFDTRAAYEAANRAANQAYEQELSSAFTDFFDAFVTNRIYFKTNSVDILYLNWGVDDLVEHMGGNTGVTLDKKESLQKQYRTEYAAKLAAKDEEINKLLAAQKQQLAARDEELRAENSKAENLQAFEKQKQFLKDDKPFDWQVFGQLFSAGFKDYSKTQAEEIKPLLAEYRKRHLEQNPIGLNMVERVEANVERILNPAATSLAKSTKTLSTSEKFQAFEKQKAFLKADQPFDPSTFVQMFIFGFKDYSREQAQEIKPLLAEYKNELSGNWARIGQMQVGQVEANVERIINPSAVATTPPPAQIAGTDGSTPHPFNPAGQTGRPPWLQSLEGAPPFDRSEFQANLHAGPSPLSRPGFSPNQQSEPDTPAPNPLVSSNIVTVKDFYPLPMEEIPGDKPHEFRFTSHRLIEGKLLLDFQYNAWVYSFDKNGSWQSSADKIFGGMAVFEPDTRRWIVAALPDPFEDPINFTPQQSILWRGTLYSSHVGKIQKYDPQKKSWQPAEFVVEGGQFYNLGGRLYRTDYNSIQEITENGHATKLLASIQRQPPVTSLDSQGALMNLALFVDAQKNLCAAVHNKIFRWDGNDWHEIGAAATSFAPEVFDADVIFSTDGFNVRPARISRFEMQSNSVELCLSQTAQESGRRVYEPRRNDASTAPKPLWKLPAELSLPNFSAAVWQSDLYLMADHSEKQDIVAEEHGTRPDGTLEISHVITGSKFASKDGYNASLFCFSRDLPAAHKICLNFEGGDGCPPMSGIESKPGFTMPGTVANRAWMQFSTNLLLCGRYAAPANFKPGIWVAALDSIAAEVNALKQMQSNAQRQEKAKAEQIDREAQTKEQQARQAFLIKFDRNHNGRIDSDEEDDARNDPYYLKYRLQEIHAQKRQ